MARTEAHIIIATGGGGSVGAKLMKTAQTTSYATGDDGDLQEGRDVDFFTLASNNPFGNTNRFTDELGGATYTNNIAIDWSTYDGSTVLGYYINYYVDGNWNVSLTASLLKSVATFTTGWKMTNLNELHNIMNYDVATTRLNYAPFFGTNLNLYASTTNPNTTTQSYYVTASTGSTNVFPKASSFSGRYMTCRNFTVTGTTLT